MPIFIFRSFDGTGNSFSSLLEGSHTNTRFFPLAWLWHWGRSQSAWMLLWLLWGSRVFVYSTTGMIWRFSTAWYGTVRFSTVHFWGVFHWVLYLLPVTFLVPPWPRFQAIRYQNVTCKLCWSLIGRIELSLLRHWTCDMRPIDPLDLNQHSQRKIGRNFCLNKLTFLYQPKNFCFIVCWGNTDVPLVDSWGADPARAWWRDAEGKSLMYILLNLLYFQSMSSVYIFNFVSVFCFN